MALAVKLILIDYFNIIKLTSCIMQNLQEDAKSYMV